MLLNLASNKHIMDISQTGLKKPTGVSGLTNSSFESILEQLKQSRGGSVTIRFEPDDEMDMIRLNKFRQRLWNRLKTRVNNSVITRINKKDISLTVWLE